MRNLLIRAMPEVILIGIIIIELIILAFVISYRNSD